MIKFWGTVERLYGFKIEPVVLREYFHLRFVLQQLNFRYFNKFEFTSTEKNISRNISQLHGFNFFIDILKALIIIWKPIVPNPFHIPSHILFKCYISFHFLFISFTHLKKNIYLLFELITQLHFYSPWNHLLMTTYYLKLASPNIKMTSYWIVLGKVPVIYFLFSTNLHLVEDDWENFLYN